MLGRRKVETRRQHEKRLQRKRQVAFGAICGEHDEHCHRTPHSPMAGISTEANEVLEIYDRRTPHTTQRKRRPRGRVQLYRRFDVKLSASSSNDGTESARSQSLTDDILSNDELESSFQYTASLNFPASTPTSSPPPRIDTKKIVPRTRSANIFVPKSIAKKADEWNTAENSTIFRYSISGIDFLCCPLDKIADKGNASANAVASEGSKAWANYLCCIFQSLVKPRPRHEPGMSVAEERRLWQIALEEDHRGTKANPAIITVGDEREIDQIEVVHVNKEFQTAGAVNYAEMEGVGIVFAPPRKNLSSQSTALLPWWKRDSWTDTTYHETGDDALAASHARASSCANKVANIRSATSTAALQSFQSTQQLRNGRLPGTRAGSMQQKDIHNDVFRRERDPSDSSDSSQQLHSHRHDRTESSVMGDFDELCSSRSTEAEEGSPKNVSHSEDFDESLDDRVERLAKQRSPQVSHQLKAIKLASSEKHRPYQVFEAKHGRQRGMVGVWREESRSSDSDTSLAINIPHLNHAYHAPPLDSKEHFPRQPLRTGVPVTVETVRGESGSEIASETDLSELVRQRNAKAPTQKLGQRNMQYSPQRNGERGAFHDSVESSQSSNPRPIICPDEMRAAKTPLKTSQTTDAPLGDKTRHLPEIRPSRECNGKTRSPRTNCRSTSPILLRGNPPYEHATQWSNADKLGKSSETDRFHEDPPVSRGRSGILGLRSRANIDFTNQNIPAILKSATETRSRSPIRLYGDPPMPRRMDGSPVRNARLKVRECSSPLHAHFEDGARDPPDCGVSEGAQQERAGMLSELRDLALNNGNLINLIATLSPKCESADAKDALAKTPTMADGSGVLLFRPTINIYKSQPNVEEVTTGEKLHKQRFDRTSYIKPNGLRREKPLLRIRTKGNDHDCENMLTADIDGMPQSHVFWATPEVAVPIDDEDDSGVDDELRQLAASEKLLRKELEEVQQRSAERRWQVNGCDANVIAVNRQRRNTLNGNVRFAGTKVASRGGTLSNVIDVSCLEDVALEKTTTLASALPVAQAFQGGVGIAARHAKLQKNDPVSKQGYSYASFPSKKITGGIKQVRYSGNLGRKEEEIEVVIVDDDSSLETREAAATTFQERKLSLTPDVENTASELFMPSSATKWRNYWTPSSNESTAQAKCSGIHSKEPASDNTDNGWDVLIERELSWRAVEQLYHLSPRDERDPEKGAKREEDIDKGGSTHESTNYHTFDDYVVDSQAYTGTGFEGKVSSDEHLHYYTGPSFQRSPVMLGKVVTKEDSDVHAFLNSPSSRTVFPASVKSNDSSFSNHVVPLSVVRGHDVTWSKVASRAAICAKPISGTARGVPISELQPMHTARIEDQSRTQVDEDDYGDISLTSSVDSIDMDLADRSLSSMLLRYDNLNYLDDANLPKRKLTHDLESSRRLRSLLLRHGHVLARDIKNDTCFPDVAQHNDEVKRSNDQKIRGIYAKLVRSGFLRGRDGIGNSISGTGLTGNIDYKDHRIEPVAKISHEDRHDCVSRDSIETKQKHTYDSKPGKRSVNRHSSTTKRLSRLRKLQSKMMLSDNETAHCAGLAKSENLLHLARGISAAPQQEKCSRRVVAKSSPERNSPGGKSQVHHCGATGRSSVDHKANGGGLVEVYMQVTGGPQLEKRKEKKKDAVHASKELHSISGSTRSKDLVHSLPAAARTRNVAAAKPGR